MRLIAIICLAVILLSSTTASAKQTMTQKAWTYYIKGDYKKAVDTCRILARDRFLGEEGRYIMGLSFLKLRNYQQARENFKFVIENYRDSDIKEQLFLGVADSYYLQGDYDKAESYYKSLLRDFPGADYASVAYLRLAISQRKQGKWQESESCFNKLIRDYPTSMEVEPAKKYLQKRNTFFTVQAGAFGKNNNARRFMSSLKDKGYDAWIEKAYEKDKLIYRVKVGNFKTSKEAETKARQLEKDGYSVRVCT
jgi:tetratricopeptide (TPR) repeat protein